MFKKALQVVTTFGVLLAGYAGYVRFFAILTAGVAPDRPATRPWEREPSKTRVEAIKLAGRGFGAGHWAADPDLPVRYYNHDRGYWMYAKEYSRLNDGKQLRFKPFAIIWRGRDGKGLKTATSDEAIIDLDQPLGLNKAGTSLKVKHARIEGNVRLRDDKGTPDSDIDDLVIGPMPYVEYDDNDLQIKSESQVVIKDRDMRITGFNLLIQLRPKDPGAPAGAAGAFDAKSAFIRRDVHIVMNDVGRSGILPGKAGAEQGEGEKTPLDLRCAGPMQVDLPRPRRRVAVGPPAPAPPTLVFFTRDVVVRRGKVGTTPDQLDCDELHLKLVPGPKAAPAAPEADDPAEFAAEADGPAPPPSATGAGTELALREALATGHAVWLRSKSQGITALCNELKHRKLSPEQPDETYLQGNAQNRLRVEKVETVAEGPDKGKVQSVTTIRTIDATIFEDGKGSDNATVVARGPGILETRTAPDQPVQRTATWQDHLVMRTEVGPDKQPVKEITLTGHPEFVDAGKATLDAQKSIVVWLKPRPKSLFDEPPGATAPGQRPPDAERSGRATSESFQIDKLKALKDVHLNAPGKVVTARDELDVRFDTPKAPEMTRSGPPIPGAPPAPPSRAGQLPADAGAPKPPPAPGARPEPEPRPAEPGVTVIGDRVWASVLLRPDAAGTAQGEAPAPAPGGAGTTKGEVQEVRLRGRVAFHQDPAPGKDRGTDVTGEALDVTTLAQGKMRFLVDLVADRTTATPTELAMAPHAKVETAEMTITGPTIMLNQVTDLAQVQGPGTLTQMVPRDMLSEKGLGDEVRPTSAVVPARKPEGDAARRPLTISWGDAPAVPAKMIFYGRGRKTTRVAVAEFSGRVRARMDDAQLSCEERMDVYMDRAVPLSRPRKPAPRDGAPDEADAPAEPKPQIALLDCFGQVRIESRKTDPQAPTVLLQKQRIMGNRVTYDKSTGEFEVPGAGRVYLWNREDESDGTQATAGRGTVKPVGNPAAPPAARRATAVTGRRGDLLAPDGVRAPATPELPPLKLTLITFDRAMKGRYMAGREFDTEPRWAHFYGDVQALNAKVAKESVEVDFDRPPDDFMFLTAQTLHVLSEPTPGTRTGSARNTLKAEEEAQAKTRNETIRADRITYDSTKELFYAYAEEGHTVSIAQQSGNSQPFSAGQSRAVLYNRKTGASQLITPLGPIQYVDPKTGVRPGPPPDPKVKPPKTPRIGPGLRAPGRGTTERKGYNGK